MIFIYNWLKKYKSTMQFYTGKSLRKIRLWQPDLSFWLQQQASDIFIQMTKAKELTIHLLLCLLGYRLCDVIVSNVTCPPWFLTKNSLRSKMLPKIIIMLPQISVISYLATIFIKWKIRASSNVAPSRAGEQWCGVVRAMYFS